MPQINDLEYKGTDSFDRHTWRDKTSGVHYCTVDLVTNDLRDVLAGRAALYVKSTDPDGEPSHPVALSDGPPRRAGELLAQKRDAQASAAQLVAVETQIREQEELKSACALAAIVFGKMMAIDPHSLQVVLAAGTNVIDVKEFREMLTTLAKHGHVCEHCLTSQSQCPEHGELATHNHP